MGWFDYQHLDSGEIDAVIAGMTSQMKTREQGADFTTPYYDSEGNDHDRKKRQ